MDRAEASQHLEKWKPPIVSEMESFNHAVGTTLRSDSQVQAGLASGSAKLVPMKVVYKPPSDEAVAGGSLCRRKARIVACGSMVDETGEDNYAAAAPAEVARTSLAVASYEEWDTGVLDITAAFLETPLSEVSGAFRVLGQPPRSLVRTGPQRAQYPSIKEYNIA